MKIKRIIKCNIFGFIVGAIIFCSIGVVLATTSVTDIWFEIAKNSNVENVEDALDDLYSQILDNPISCYNGTCGELSYRYWNGNFSETRYDSNQMPVTNYISRALLEKNYSNFSGRPFYIRSILINGNVVGHQVCLWQNNREYCMKNKYWFGTIGTENANAGLQTRIKLQREMQKSLDLTIQDSACYSDATDASCYVGSYLFYTRYAGGVGCNIGETHCVVDALGRARCGE